MACDPLEAELHERNRRGPKYPGVEIDSEKVETNRYSITEKAERIDS